MRRHLCPMLWIQDRPVPGQQMRQPSDLASAHGIGLSGERERSSAWHADLSSGQVQVDERIVLAYADRALVHAHAPEADDGLRTAEQACRFSNARGRQPTDLLHGFGE